MDQEKELEQKFKEYENLSKQDKEIDTAALMMNALENQQKDLLTPKIKRWAYFISVAFPPFGLLFAIKFYFFSDKSDAKRTANICVILTILVFALIWFIGRIMFQSAGVDMNQVQQINPQDLQDLLK